MAKKNKGGRPSVMTEQTIQKLEQGFMYGFTDREACLYADIAPATLYNYCEKHPEFLERKELLKERPKMRAKIVVVNDIQRDDVATSKWYLERKAKDEFSALQGIEHTGQVELGTGIDDIKDFIKNLKKKNVGSES